MPFKCNQPAVPTVQQDDAVAMHRQAVDLAPGRPEIHSNLLLSLHYSLAADAALIDQESRRWNVMLAQNPYAAQILGKAYAFLRRPIWVEGYPRNDVLTKGDDGSRVFIDRVPDGRTLLRRLSTPRSRGPSDPRPFGARGLRRQQQQRAAGGPGRGDDAHHPARAQRPARSLVPAPDP